EPLRLEHLAQRIAAGDVVVGDQDRAALDFFRRGDHGRRPRLPGENPRRGRRHERGWWDRGQTSCRSRRRGGTQGVTPAVNRTCRPKESKPSPRRGGRGCQTGGRPLSFRHVEEAERRGGVKAGGGAPPPRPTTF